MKKNMTKRLLAALLAAVMALSLAACSGGDNAGSGDQAASAALTEEEYQQAVEDLGAEMTEIQNNASTAMTDPESAKEVLESMKAPLNDFIAITPPEAYAAGHEKMQSGCQSMIDFIDTVVAMTEETDQTKLTELVSQMDEQLRTAVNDMAEGASLLDEASRKPFTKKAPHRGAFRLHFTLRFGIILYIAFALLGGKGWSTVSTSTNARRPFVKPRQR